MDNRFFLKSEPRQQERGSHQARGFRLGSFPNESVVDPLESRVGRFGREVSEKRHRQRAQRALENDLSGLPPGTHHVVTEVMDTLAVREREVKTSGQGQYIRLSPKQDSHAPHPHVVPIVQQHIIP